MLISSVEGVHTPFEMVQRNVLIPTLKPVTPEVGDVGVVTVALPAITVQAPVPTAGVFPASVAVVAHTLWSGPAAETVGTAFLVITTLSMDAAQGPFVIVHRNVLAPTPKPVIPETGEEGVVMVPAPVMSVQLPVPTSGVFPAKVAVVAHTV